MSTQVSPSGSGRVEGKIALISGGASGIGLATAERLAREGAKVAITDVDVAKGEALADRLKSEGHDVIFRELNVVDPASWAAVVEAVVDRWGSLDILLNSAGIGRAHPLMDMTLEEWQQTISINLDGTFLGTQAAMRAMAASDGGSIINISSVAGLVGLPMASAYSASKGGVKLFTKAAALECAELKLNIRINSVHPGYIETPMVMRRFKDLEAEADDIQKLKEQHPLGRLGQREEVASMILYLASDESAFVTGAEFVIDGGYSAK
ncbi:glucose 1-dehydrogenase [Sneathiella marina]|uniref:Glucose 1-dehydrogenase n=1 Tax=Sneathiella marina TaxID=2950108 RepID=A0ABY4W604_9PROT|nr:glucose 1-dehydrogenase [Sneathiella marina]USG61553.1 glucose 1-dehydrogenase [Sneathiella marina]